MSAGDLVKLAAVGANGHYLSPGETARLLGVKRQTCRKYAKDGKLERVQPHGPRTSGLYTRASVEALLDARNRGNDV